MHSMFQLMTGAFDSCMGMSFFPLLTSRCVLCMLCLISCCFFQVFLIVLFFNQIPDIAGRKLHFRKCLSDTALQSLSADIYSSKETEKRSFLHSVTVVSCPEWEVWSSLCLFWALWSTTWWWAWQKYTPVTICDLTPPLKIFEGMSFFSLKQFKLALHLKCTMGHLALTQALSDDVISRKPPLGQQGGK